MVEIKPKKKMPKYQVRSIRCGCGCHTGNYHPKKKATICTACGTIQEVNIEKMKKTKKKGAKKKNAKGEK